MYYLYGIGAFNEVAFVAMLKAGMDTGVYGAVARVWRKLPVCPHYRRVAGGDSGPSAGRSRPASVLGFRRCCWAQGSFSPVANFVASLITGLVIGLAIGYVIILARKFTINQSDSTYGADVMMGAGNASGRFLGPLIILSAMTASIPIGVGSLLGALLFYLWQKPITGGRDPRRHDFRFDLPDCH
ncbi:Uncharacterised protein [Citrobacter koseri]|uniref:Inner membrane protein n=1 Tax=Citrobacter koseri TaxID=545 RepID=A0A447UQI0_CITKO|nr:Uncharacterised protein [Citrobacter koseri]